MPSHSRRVDPTRRDVTPLKTVSSGPFSMPGGAAVPGGVPNGRRRSDSRATSAPDVAQSRLFEAFLLDELDELEDQVAGVERRRRRRGAEEIEDPVTVPHALLHLRDRIKEVRRLLDALRERFPQD
ncbi:MAG: hypothetical protein M3O32_08755 [Actinomycetota bacterium]|nr:hypothetical protein [Actinomycetota bacterium]